MGDRVVGGQPAPAILVDVHLPGQDEGGLADQHVPDGLPLQILWKACLWRPIVWVSARPIEDAVGSAVRTVPQPQDREDVVVEEIVSPPAESARSADVCDKAMGAVADRDVRACCPDPGNPCGALQPAPTVQVHQ